jgi:23S rRNA (uracil1939-C5)-methyltransferase
MNCNNQVVDINKIVNGGYGLARDADGRAVLVRFAVPGERVALKITHQKKRVAFGHVVEVLRSGPGRIEPPCPYYGRCGGCDLQHLAYQAQCAIKSDVLTELVSRSREPLLSSRTDLIKPFIVSATPFGYRHRIRMKVDDRGRLGFNHFRSNRIISVSRCLLAAGPINRCLAGLCGNREFSMIAKLSTEVELIYNPLSCAVSMLISLNRIPRSADRNRARSLCRDLDVLERVFHKGQDFPLEGPYCGDVDDEERLGRSIGFTWNRGRQLHFSWEIGGFSQVNLEQNAVLIELIKKLSQVQPEDRVLDLYCGMGNFSLLLADQCHDIHGIEGQGAAIRSARANARANQLDNCRYTKSDVFSACRELTEHRKSFDIVICDPPRSGLNDLVELLPGLTRKRLIYVSCDPATLCRDLEHLSASGFILQTLQPLDMFPQTHHIETVAVLEKRPNRQRKH